MSTQEDIFPKDQLTEAGDSIRARLKDYLPLNGNPLIHCITNEVTMESVADALLAIKASPVMCQERFQAENLVNYEDALLLNIGMVNQEKAYVLTSTAQKAAEAKKPIVLDLVGVSSQPILLNLGRRLAAFGPMLIKGNYSEIRAFLGMETKGKGVDADASEQGGQAALTLAKEMLSFSQSSESVLVATGPNDLVAAGTKVFVLENGVDWLGQFTGSGDMVGSLVAAIAGDGAALPDAALAALSLFNIAGERAKDNLTSEQAIASFKVGVLDQLTLVSQDPAWAEAIKGGYYEN